MLNFLNIIIIFVINLGSIFIYFLKNKKHTVEIKSFQGFISERSTKILNNNIVHFVKYFIRASKRVINQHACKKIRRLNCSKNNENDDEMKNRIVL